MINFNLKKNKIEKFCPAMTWRSKGFTQTLTFKKRKKLVSGFTLVETLVALFIFSISVLTVMSVLSKGISSTIYAKDKIVAEYLSQEGIEYFRNMRDIFSDDKTGGWEKFVETLKISGCEEGGCYFSNDEDDFFQKNSTTEIPIIACVDKCPNFLYESKLGKYNYNTGGKSTFSRKMLIKEIDSDNIKITSEVTYSAGTNTSAVSLSENLSNWID